MTPIAARVFAPAVLCACGIYARLFASPEINVSCLCGQGGES